MTEDPVLSRCFDQPEEDRIRLSAILEKIRNLAEGEMIEPAWLGQVNRLLDRIKLGAGPTPKKEERLDVYKAVRESGILPEEAAFFLIANTVEWIAEDRVMADFERRAADARERRDLAAMEKLKTQDPADTVRITTATFVEFDEPEMARLYQQDRPKYEQIKESGRLYFFEQGDPTIC